MNKSEKLHLLLYIWIITLTDIFLNMFVEVSLWMISLGYSAPLIWELISSSKKKVKK